jgi:hypothetical protein
MGEVTFTDVPPYVLPAVQGAEARAVDNGVELALFVNIPDRPLATVPILIVFPLDAARKLSGQFQTAVATAESAAGRQH